MTNAPPLRAPLLAVLLLSACSGGVALKDDGSGDSGGGDSGDSGSAPTTLEGVTARLSTGVETVVIVDYPPVAGADRVWVEYGADAAYGAEAPERDAGQALVLGTPPDTTLHLRLAAAFGTATAYSDDLTITTGPLADGVPTVNTSDLEPGEPWGEFVLTSAADMGRGRSTIVAFNRAGEPVWWVPRQNGFILSFKPSRDGRSILYLWEEDIVDSAHSNICRFDMSGEDETCIEVNGAHHDFWQLEDGSLVYPKSKDETWGEYDLISDQLVKRATDGTTTVLWDAFVDITPDPEGQNFRPDRSGAVDWIHTNGIWHDPDEDAWYISSFQLLNVRKVPAATGRAEWVLGEGGDFTIDGSFGAQHAPQLTDEGLYLFDNASNRDPSGLVRFTIDTETMHATETLRVTIGTNVHASVMGDAHLLPGGYLGGTFGDASRVAIFSHEGDELWVSQFDSGLLVGPVYAYDTLYGMLPN